MEIIPASEYWDLIAKSRETSLLALIYRVPPRLWREISSIQNQLKAIDERQLFARPSILHITVKVLRLIGDNTDAQELEELILETQKVVREFRPFDISFKGLGIFPTSIYIKIEDTKNQLQMLNKRIIAELGDKVERGQYDGDSYIPHVTITTFNTKEANELISKVRTQEMRQIEFGSANVFELEAVEARMYLLLGPEDVQDQGLEYLRTIHLSN